MSNGIYGIDNYYSEILFTLKNINSLFQQYITYDKKKIKERTKSFNEDFKKYSLKAWANVPISGNEILDLYVAVLKNNDIENFTVNYRTILDPHLDRSQILIPVIPGYSKQDIFMMLIRSDYGHGKGIKHTNIDLYTKDGKKISDSRASFVIQNFTIPFYEMAIHYVFMQVEKHNILIGPEYWLAPFQIHLRRIKSTYDAWLDSKILTPLCVLSRNIHTQLTLLTHQQKKEISENEFCQILDREIINCRKFEVTNPDSINVNFVSTKDFMILPFNFFKPDENAIAGSYEYKLGVKHALKFEQYGIEFSEKSNLYYYSNL